MPTSTQPFEILFEVHNDTLHSTTLQAIRGEPRDSPTLGPTATITEYDELSLVLDAGRTYRYVLYHLGERAEISVRVWKDTQISVSDIFVRRRPPEADYPSVSSVGITISFQGPHHCRQASRGIPSNRPVNGGL
ncbi:hypothetical protein CPB83DRAFT_904131 [Crepidotus variabilis]|uniref:Uncharacterized protein n=1 Tax=Crepidotus variabilis TaxID=179855 RepID=A0A9P6EN75_9AGAR|nr:hypothetical protein CPB83DRAFT_904131 [Crepidotus variabilis]